MKRVSLLLFLALMMLACAPNESPLDQALASDPLLKKIAEQKEKYQVQIIYTQIDRDSLNRPHFTTYHFNVDSSRYFYPASTVKFPACILAMEKLNHLGNDEINLSTTFLVDSASAGQTTALYDSTSENGMPSIGHYIKKILLVSDNDAFNRLYEFLGQQPFNDSLAAKGYTDSRIIHRLSIALSEDENRLTNPWRFIQDSTVLASGEGARADKVYRPDSALLLGKAYISNDEKVEAPMDFAAKNFFPLDEQHRMLGAVLFPGQFPGAPAFHLNDSDYAFLYKYMSMWPSETQYPDYRDLPDHYVKYVMLGDSLGFKQPGMRIFNKIGQAYGYLTDNAYIIDQEKGIEFMVSVTLFVNENETFNDNTYEYDEIGLPFMGKLGRALYEIEKSRERAFMPDLSRFSVNYTR